MQQAAVGACMRLATPLCSTNHFTSSELTAVLCHAMLRCFAQVLGEVLQPGDRLLVAHGGKGGRGVVAPSRIQKQQELKKEYKRAQVSGGWETGVS